MNTHRNSSDSWLYHSRHPIGFTMIETLVSISIIGLLMATIIPAVQYARESARRTECKNRLKQMILACHNHVEAHGNFGTPGAGSDTWMILLLPYLEQPKPVLLNSGQIIGGPKHVALYRCPSDPYSLGSVFSHIGLTYFPNDGHGIHLRDGFYRDSKGQQMHPRDISDGLSNTAAICERRALPDSVDVGTDFTDPVWHHRIVRKTSAFLFDYDEFADDCEYNSVPPLVTLYVTECYTHTQTPNRHSCVNGDTSSSPLQYAAFTVSSLHSSGVNLALADGSVRFISDLIDRNVWRAIGTRNGNETIGSEF